MPNWDIDGVFSSEQMLANLAGNIKLAKMIIPSAKQDIDACFVKLQEAISSDNLKEAKIATHTIKGLLAQIGGVKVAKEMREADDALKYGKELGIQKVHELGLMYKELIAAAIHWSENVN